jgi:ketosteroid isomerase-like protein
MRGEVGAESGTFVESAASGDNGAIATGAYVTIYTRIADGRWRIAIDVRTTGAHPPAVAW